MESMSKKNRKHEADEVAPGTTAPTGGMPGVDGAGEGAVADVAEALQKDLEAARAEAAAASDRALRTLAEFDNYRRRTEREREESVRRGRADVLRELLEVADNFDRALEHAGDGVPQSFLEGMQLVARGLHDLLDRKGVARIEAEGAPFDPEIHEALGAIPTEGAEPNTVIRVVQAGYRLDDRVLRPSKVLVAAAPPAAPAESAVEEGAGETATGEE
jgi:molecular chaperone GrpE